MANKQAIPKAIWLSKRTIDNLNTLAFNNNLYTGLQMIIKSYVYYQQGKENVLWDKVKFTDFKPYSVIDKSKRHERLTKLVRLKLSQADYMILKKVARKNKIYSVQELIRQIVDYCFAYLEKKEETKNER